MIGMLAPLIIVAGCTPDSSDPVAPDPGSADAPGDTGDSGGSGGTEVPGCPFTEAEVSDLVGQPMVDQGSCLFGDGNGVATLTVTMASQLAGETTLDYSREQAALRFDRVAEVDRGGIGYIAVGELGGEAVLISEAGSYTLIMSSFERLDPAGYEQTLNALIASIAD